jgi:hypothetical protein
MNRRTWRSPSEKFAIALLWHSIVDGEPPYGHDGNASSRMPSLEITVMAKSINDGEPVLPEA